ncbi:MAG: hypothetical protein H6582_05635 [Crocinitomicaceae bacterium]|nr:hypothetical protein [Crocinitomicaceae bacterium]
MQYKELLSIDNCGHSFLLLENFLIYLNKEGNCFILEIDSSQATQIEGDFQKLEKIDDSTFVMNQGFSSILYEIRKNQEVVLDFKIESVISKFQLATIKSEESRDLCLIRDFKNVLWKINRKRGKFLLFEDGLLLNSKYLDDSILQRFDIQSGELLWELKLNTSYPNENLKIVKLLGEFNGFIYCLLSNSLVLVLSLENGEIIKTIYNERNLDQGDFYRQFADILEFSKNQGKIVQLLNDRLTIIDLKENLVEEHLIAKSINGLVFNGPRVLYNDYIYFYSRSIDSVGRVNISTKEIEILFELEKMNLGQIVTIHPSFNRIALKDVSGKLCLFELV